MKNFIFFVLLFIAQYTHAQSIGIGSTNPPDPSAALDVNSTTKGFLMPRMFSTQRVGIGSPMKGLQVFDNNTNSFWYYNGTAWTDVYVGNFSLPFSSTGSVTFPNSLFSITNTGTGRAILGETTVGLGNAGIGVYGLASNTSPSVGTSGVSGVNLSTNPFGYGVSGTHEGSGTAIYGVVKGAGTAVKGFASNLFGATGNGIGVEGISTLTYGVKGTSNSGDAVYGESNNGRGVYGKSTSSTGVRGESSSGTGIYGTSSSNYGVYASSSSGTGVYGYSGGYYGGYFENYSSTYATLVSYNYGSGGAARFYGNVRLDDNLQVDGTSNLAGNVTMGNNAAVDGTLTVKSGKGIVRSNSATQLKISLATSSLGATISAGSYIEGGTLTYSAFGSPPVITVGNVLNDESTGDWQKVIVVPIDVTATQCSFRITNLSSSSATFNAKWRLTIIGAE